MRPPSVRLWPYGATAAILAGPLIWIALVAIWFATRHYVGWSASSFEQPVWIFFFALSAIPLVLLLLDFIALKRGVVGNDWLKIDFSRTVVEFGAAQRSSFGLADNILSPTERLTDSGGMKLVATISKAMRTELVCIDLKDGNAWWLTRLLVLCAAAADATSLRAVVFIGTRGNKERTFLGWAAPGQLLEAMLNAKPEYRERVTTARTIARQLSLFGQEVSGFRPLAGTPPIAVGLHARVAKHQWSFDANEPVMFAKILLDELQSGTPAPTGVPINLEEPPERLTASRLTELFDHCLYIDSIERSDSNEAQLSNFLASTAPYIATLRQGFYEGMLRSDLGERAIIRELFSRSQTLQAEGDR